MRRVMAAFMLMAMVLGAVAAPATAQDVEYPVDGYQFPSTNDANKANGGPYVELVDSGPGWVRIAFVDPQGYASWEYRLDGKTLQFPKDCPDEIDQHKVIGRECRYSSWRVTDPDVAGGTVETYTFGSFDWPWVYETIEIRKAGGAERDTDYDWVTFYIPPAADPYTRGNCVANWDVYGFSNQGQCIKFLNTGEDSRP